MSTEVYIGSIDVIGGNYPNYDLQMFEFAEAVSQSSNFNIIDSYTTHWWYNRPYDGDGDDPNASYTSKRHKGDPIADTEERVSGITYPIWYNRDDVGFTNNWIVIECQTENPTLATMGYSGLPKWQLKIQWASGDFFDVSDTSGEKYPKNHDTSRKVLFRFAPWGGWDLEDTEPDFNPSGSPVTINSTGNHEADIGGGSTMARTQRLVFSSGQLIWFATTERANKGVCQFAAVIGDVVPKSISNMINPRAMMLNGTGSYTDISYSGWLQENGGWSNGGYYDDYDVIDKSDGGISFWDWSGNLIETPYSTQRRSALSDAQQNAYSNLITDSHPVIVFPRRTNIKGFFFELSYIRKAFGPCVQTSRDRNNLFMDWGWSPVLPWDGSTDPYDGY